MRIQPRYRPLFDRVDAASVKAAEDTLADMVGHQHRRTGRLAAGMQLVTRQTSAGPRHFVVNDVVYANANERGVNARVKASVKAGTKRRTTGSKKAGTYQVISGPLLNRKTRRGPHMAGNHVIADNGPRFLEHMTARLRASV